MDVSKGKSWERERERWMDGGKKTKSVGEKKEVKKNGKQKKKKEN